MHTLANTRPDIATRLFWDIDVQAVDYDRDSLMVMERVLNYGNWADVKAIINYYGRQKMKEEVVKMADLKKDTLSFLCVLLHLSPENFSCYNRRQSQPHYWHY